VPQPIVIEGEEEWEVEKISNKRKVQVFSLMEGIHSRGGYLGE